MALGRMLERAAREQRISRQEWEALLEMATLEEEVLVNGEAGSLVRLVSLLQGGMVAVDDVPHTEILRRLAVFA